MRLGRRPSKSSRGTTRRSSVAPVKASVRNPRRKRGTLKTGNGADFPASPACWARPTPQCGNVRCRHTSSRSARLVRLQVVSTTVDSCGRFATLRETPGSTQSRPYVERVADLFGNRTFVCGVAGGLHSAVSSRGASADGAQDPDGPSASLRHRCRLRRLNCGRLLATNVGVTPRGSSGEPDRPCSCRITRLGSSPSRASALARSVDLSPPRSLRFDHRVTGRPNSRPTREVVTGKPRILGRQAIVQSVRHGRLVVLARRPLPVQRDHIRRRFRPASPATRCRPSPRCPRVEAAVHRLRYRSAQGTFSGRRQLTPRLHEWRRAQVDLCLLHTGRRPSIRTE
jgi:hypothetical protein